MEDTTAARMGAKELNVSGDGGGRVLHCGPRARALPPLAASSLLSAENLVPSRVFC
jgi:hypothetical protein